MALTINRRYQRREVFGSRTLPVHAARTIHGDHNESPHDHDFVEMVVVTAGRAMHQTVNGIEPIKRGDAFILRPGMWHGYQQSSRLQIINLCFGYDLLGYELAWLMEDARMRRIFWNGAMGEKHRGVIRMQLDQTQFKNCCSALDQLAESLNTDGNRPAMQMGRLLVCLELLTAAIEMDDDAMPSKTLPAVVSRAVQMLEHDPGEDWHLGELAARLNIDPSYLSRLFKSNIGLPPMRYLARCRAERAASLLLRTHQNIGDIAAAVGWTDPIVFARRFRGHFGMTATQYRQRFG